MTFSPTHYCRTTFRFGEVEAIPGAPNAGRVKVRWSNGDTSRVRSDALTPLERPPVSPGAIVRPFVAERIDDGVVSVPKSPPVRSRSYKEWIRSQPCAWTLEGYRPREASHHPEPMHGRKAAKTDDTRCLPLLPEVHRQFTQTQTIGDMDAEKTKAWVEAEIAATLTRYLRDECGWTAREINTRIVRLLSGLVDEEMQQRRAG